MIHLRLLSVRRFPAPLQLSDEHPREISLLSLKHNQVSPAYLHMIQSNLEPYVFAILVRPRDSGNCLSLHVSQMYIDTYFRRYITRI